MVATLLTLGTAASASASFARLAWQYLSAPVEATELKIVIITDWHTNPLYNASFGEACACMRLGFASPEDCLLPEPASEYGQFGCDASPALAKAALRAAAAAMPDPSIVLVLGDLVMHGSPSASFDHGVFHNMSRLIHDAFPNRPYACQVPLGNNDVFPNYGIDNANASYYATQAASAMQFCGLDDAQAKMFTAKGYYARELAPRERLVILNTNIYASQHAVNRTLARTGRFYADRWSMGTSARAPTSRGRRLTSYPDVDPQTEPDPLGQFAWLEAHFKWARSNGGRLHISAHIPPTLDSYTREQQWQMPYALSYWTLIERYADVLGFQLYGHLHSSEVRPVQLPASRAVARAPAMQILTSVSPIYKSNPAFYTVRMAMQARSRQDELSVTMHAFDLQHPPPAGEVPSFVPLEPRPLDTASGLGGTNEEYNELFASMLATPSNASTDAAFDAFFHAFRGGYTGHAACNRTDVVFQECASCTRGCRVSFVCLQMAGRLPDEYDECLRRHEGWTGA